jgi:CheY-like chemotaxis protein
VPDGQEAVAYLSGSGRFADRELCPLPALILLDINMPKKSGFEVLEWIRRQPNLKSVPVLMFTSSSNLADREKARQLAADDYLLKPSDPLKLAELVKSLNERWLSQTARQLDAKGAEPGPRA